MKMKTTYRLNDKKVSKKALIEKIGKDRIERLTKEAWETHMEDPYICNDFFMGRHGMLNISFSF
jgi:hypothetical protein